MKKLAVRVGVTMAIVVACSMFFANTILSITTPKVKFAEVGYKRFEEQISREASVYFTDTNAFTVEGARKTPIIVDVMYVRVGDRVAAGDTIATTRLPDSFAEEVNAASDALVAARQAYMQNETDNFHLVNTIDSDKNEAKRAMDDTSRALAEIQAKLLGEAAKAGILLSEDTRTWAAAIQRGGDEGLTALMEAVLDAQTAADRASEAFLETFANSRTKTEVYEFLLRRADLQRDWDRAQNRLVELVSVGESMGVIRAEHEGYIVSLGISENALYDGSEAAYELTVLGEGLVLRCDISGVKRELTEGMRADIRGEYGDIRAEVSAVVREGTDSRFLHIPLDDEMISRLGGMRMLLQNGATVRLTYRAREATTVLPPAAVRSEGDGRGDFIYVAEYRYDVWGSYMVARKLPVTVLERGDKEIAIQEDLRYGSRPIYQESKALKEGGRIEEYVD